MVLNKFTGSVLMDGNEDSLFKIVGTAMKTFASYIYLKALQAGDTIRLRVYSRVDDVSHWKLDGDVTDSVGGNNGTVTNISSFVSQWKFDGNVNDSIGSNNGTITYHTNLKKLYKFESNVNDTIGNGNGTIVGSGSSYVTGQEGTAINLDSSTYVSFPSTNLPTGTTDRSVSFWVKTPSSFTASTYLFDWGANSNNNAFGVIYTSTGSTSTITAVGFANDKASSTVLQVNTWYHIVITLSSSGTIRNLYVNGVLDSNFPFTATALNTTSSSVYLNSIIGGGNEAGGTYDEFRIYNIVLTQAQVSALYMNGKFAQSHTFDQGESISVGNPSNLAFSKTTPFSISAWVKIQNMGDNQIIISKMTSSIHSQGWYFWISSTALIFDLNDGTIKYETLIFNNYNDGLYHHVVATYDGSNNQNGMKIYVDGVLVVTGSSLTGLGTITNANNVIIGGSNGAGNFCTGQLDELRIYNIALSASQVLGLYNYTGSNYITPLPVGNALSLDGSSYVTVTNQTPYNFERTNSFSVSGWIKTTSNTLEMVTKNNGDATKGYEIGINASGKIIIRIINTASTNEINVVDSGSAVNDGNWHNFIVTYSGTSLASGVSLYVDGSSRSLTTTTNNLSSTIQNTNNVIIGANGDASNKFVGLIDEVQIWNYVVSSTEINAINAGRFANTHPIGYWKFDGDLYDYSGQGSTGTPTGTMTYVTGALSGSYNVPNTHFNFDGSEYVTAGNPSNLSFEVNQPFSIVTWFRTFVSSGSFNAIIAKENAGADNGWYIDNNGTGIEFVCHASGGTASITTNGVGQSVNDGLWHQIVATYDGTLNRSGMKIYIDGVLTQTGTSSVISGTMINSDNVTIGAFSNAALVLSAELDDLRIYNRALSSAEVSDLYTYPDSAMKQLVYDRSYSGPKSDVVYVPTLQGNQYMVTAQQTSGTNRIISWEQEEYT